MNSELLAMQAAQTANKNEGRYETLSVKDRAQQVALDALEAIALRDEQVEMSIDNLNTLH